MIQICWYVLAWLARPCFLASVQVVISYSHIETNSAYNYLSSATLRVPLSSKFVFRFCRLRSFTRYWHRRNEERLQTLELTIVVIERYAATERGQRTSDRTGMRSEIPLVTIMLKRVQFALDSASVTRILLMFGNCLGLENRGHNSQLITEEFSD